ncbi:flavodoxin family protein [Baileyella intestinalis]|uniref:flavodoxin family protein n=1 Tax=Baileyella intestinalis TaxID=2606709 RepID=UPI0022E2B99C|nr:flavodoxin family protein [Baileyella intestinalis]
MKIVVLNGSPNTDGNTAFLIDSFKEGAEAAGHTVTVLQIGQMDVTAPFDFDERRKHGKRDFPDDESEILKAMEEADMLVLASPIYYFMVTFYLEGVIQHLHGYVFPKSIRKTALLLSSGSDGVYDAAIQQYHMIFQDYMGLEDAGVFTAHGAENKSEEKFRELVDFGRSLR